MTFTPYALDPELDLELTRETDVAPELVWRAWTEPELLVQWFTPKPWETPVAEVDLRPGGKFRTVMRGPDGEENDNQGCYLEVVPNERLVWTAALAPGFRPQPGPMPFTAVIELERTPAGGTRYRAVAMHQDPEGRKAHDEMGFHDGWGAVFDQLVELMKTGA
jgi:uncharacterized protein YndB with AHSA1/START domain